MSEKIVTLEQLLESARQSEALAMQVAQAAQTALAGKASTEQVNAAVAELFTSVSDGKALIASAITDKGVATAQDAPFQTMRENILAIESGGGLPEGVYQIDVSASTAEGGTVSGGGVASEGMTLTVAADVADGYDFEGWQENGEVVSAENPYTFTVTGSRAFVAGFEEATKQPIWNNTSAPSSKSFNDVVYGGGKFVATSYLSSDVAYSTDGITWKNATLPSSAGWTRIAYGNGKYVVVADEGRKAAYSTDGITWKSATLPFSSDWYGVAYGNGKFVAVTWSGTNKYAYSTDGITWKSATLPSSLDCTYITYGGSKFAAVANYSDKVVHSVDGISWALSSLPLSAAWRHIAYGNGKFFIVANSAETLAYSQDGLSWLSSKMPFSGYWTGAAYGDGKYVAVASGTDKAALSLLLRQLNNRD